MTRRRCLNCNRPLVRRRCANPYCIGHDLTATASSLPRHGSSQQRFKSATPPSSWLLGGHRDQLTAAGASAATERDPADHPPGRRDSRRPGTADFRTRIPPDSRSHRFSPHLGKAR